MTNEEIIEVLHELDGSLYETQQVALDLAIKALEQQSSDCVSRADLYKILKPFGEQPLENDIATDLIYLVKDSDIVELPPVTPTHGTCKDCKYCEDIGIKGTLYCKRYGINHLDSYYCADFEKRGDEK